MLLAVSGIAHAPHAEAAAGINYVPLAPINMNGSEFTSTSGCVAPTCFPKYLRTIFNVGIAMAGLFAVFSIIRGGFTLIFTDSILGHSEGKGMILRAVGGLLLTYSSYILMNQISPALGRDLDLSLDFTRVTIKEDTSSLQIISSENVENAWITQLKTANAEIRSLKDQAAEKRALALAATDPTAKTALQNEAATLEAQALNLENKTSPSAGIKNAYRQALGALWDTGYGADYKIKDAAGREIPLASASAAQRIAEADRLLGIMELERGRITALSASGTPNIPIAEQTVLLKELQDAKTEVLKQKGYLQKGCDADNKKMEDKYIPGSQFPIKVRVLCS